MNYTVLPRESCVNANIREVRHTRCWSRLHKVKELGVLVLLGRQQTSVIFHLPLMCWEHSKKAARKRGWILASRRISKGDGTVNRPRIFCNGCHKTEVVTNSTTPCNGTHIATGGIPLTEKGKAELSFVTCKPGHPGMVTFIFTLCSAEKWEQKKSMLRLQWRWENRNSMNFSSLPHSHMPFTDGALTPHLTPWSTPYYHKAPWSVETAKIVLLFFAGLFVFNYNPQNPH